MIPCLYPLLPGGCALRNADMVGDRGTSAHGVRVLESACRGADPGDIPPLSHCRVIPRPYDWAKETGP